MPWYVNTYNNNYALPPKFNRLSSHIIMLLVLGESQVSNFVLERKKKKTKPLSAWDITSKMVQCHFI